MATLENRLKALETKKTSSKYWDGPKNQKWLFEQFEADMKADYQVKGVWLDGWDFDALEGESFDDKFSTAIDIALHDLSVTKTVRHQARHLVALIQDLDNSI